MTTTENAPGSVPAPQPPAGPATAAAQSLAQTTIRREPVVTMDGRVVGYTLRITPEDHSLYLDLDLPNLVADRFVFLPATAQMLAGDLPQPVVPGRLVLDLPLGWEDRPDASERARDLRALGAQLCLLDYRGTPAQEALLPYVAFVVVDPRAGLPMPQLIHHVHLRTARVLVSDVHAPAEIDACRAAGADGMRGGYAARTEADARPTTDAAPPSPTTAPAPAAPDGGSRVLRAGELQCLAVLHLLHSDEVDFSAVSQVIDTDPVLSLRVLHLVNSGAFALSAPVDTVQRAVVLLGARELSTLLSALMVDARPDAMDSLWFILARALTCETLAGDPAAYTVGMMSALAAQLGVPVDLIVDKVGVSDAVASAICAEEGELGAVLAAVRAHESNDDGAILAAGLLPGEVSAAYLRAVTEARETARVATRESAL